ncbi:MULTISPECIES: hypothetical protein [Pseudomonadota]|uniref:hypothetical protein n=1 Tax=Pseudomonadota TaxID=1224 RepID=UPI003298B59F
MMSWQRNNSAWGRGRKESEDVARVVAAVLGAWAAGREENVCVGTAPFAEPAVCGKFFTYNRADLAAGNKNIFTVPFSREKNIYRPAPPKKKKITVPSGRGKKYIPSRPAEEKIFTVPSRRGKQYLPPRNIIFTVLSRRGKKHLPSRPVVKISPVDFYRPVPSRKYAPAVPSHCVPRTLYVLISPSSFHFFSPPNEYDLFFTILSHCDKPWRRRNSIYQVRIWAIRKTEMHASSVFWFLVS